MPGGWPDGISEPSRVGKHVFFFGDETQLVDGFSPTQVASWKISNESKWIISQFEHKNCVKPPHPPSHWLNPPQKIQKTSRQ